MGRARTTTAAGVLVVEAGLAALGVQVHRGFTAEYGDITHSAVDSWRAGFSSGVRGLALGLVGVVALVAVSVATQRWARVTALALPVLMVAGMLAVTPAALHEKLVTQYDDAPSCVSADFTAPGPGSDAVRESQTAFDSIEHVGHFSRGGGSGVGGCDRAFVLLEDVDVLQHYDTALTTTGWRLVARDPRRLRAERDGTAFEVVRCGRGGVVWAGRADVTGAARCAPVHAH